MPFPHLHARWWHTAACFQHVMCYAYVLCHVLCHVVLHLSYHRVTAIVLRHALCHVLCLGVLHLSYHHVQSCGMCYAMLAPLLCLQLCSADLGDSAYQARDGLLSIGSAPVGQIPHAHVIPLSELSLDDLIGKGAEGKVRHRWQVRRQARQGYMCDKCMFFSHGVVPQKWRRLRSIPILCLLPLRHTTSHIPLGTGCVRGFATHTVRPGFKQQSKCLSAPHRTLLCYCCRVQVYRGMRKYAGIAAKESLPPLPASVLYHNKSSD
jgi:hypothetical protein